MAKKFSRVVRNVLLAYIGTAIGGMHFAANMAFAADATCAIVENVAAVPR